MPEEQPGNAAVATLSPNTTLTTSHMASLAPPEGRGGGPSLTEILLALPETANRDAYVKRLIDAEAERQKFRQNWQLAYQFAMSGMFADVKGQTERQGIAMAITKVQLGDSYGLAPADAMRFINIIQGQPTVANQIVASKLREAGYDWDIEWQEEIEQHKGKPYKRCTGCTLWLKVWSEKDKAHIPVTDRKGEQISYSFTEADADRAMIWEGGKQIPLSQKWNFKSWPRDMYFWRTIARVHKYHAPHIMRGAVAQAEVWDVPLEQDMDQSPVDETKSLEPPEAPETPSKVSLKDALREQTSLLDEKP